MSHVAHYEWVISHIWMCQTTRMNTWYGTYERAHEWATRHTCERVTLHPWMRDITHTNTTSHTCMSHMSHIWMCTSMRHTCERVTPHSWMHHITYLNAPTPHTCVSPMSHMWMCTQMCHTSHTRTSQPTHTNASYHTHMNALHHTHNEWVMSHAVAILCHSYVWCDSFVRLFVWVMSYLCVSRSGYSFLFMYVVWRIYICGMTSLYHL